jgi:hypothetical protein
VEESDAGAAQRLQRGQVQALELRIGKNGELGGLKGDSVDVLHGSFS